MSNRINTRKDKFIARFDEFDNIFKNSDSLIKFSLKYFVAGEGYGESFEQWQDEKILAELNNKLKDFSSKTKVELLQDGTLEIYNGYPGNSTFEKPPALKGLEIHWARLRLTGRRRVIGFFLPEKIYTDCKGQDKTTDSNIFHVVFLDKEHMFAPYRKRNT